MSDEARAVVERFNEAINRHDVDGAMALMTDDVVFESTAPPDGERREGQDDVRLVWEKLFEAAPDARFDTEETIVCGDRVVVRWRYSWGEGGSGGHVRGIDLFAVRDGKVAEKLSYVKG